MFQKNQRHFQIPLTSNVDELPEKLRKRLDTSWSEVFYREFFSRLNETHFGGLYADCPSRPNVPINVLVGLEYLKAGNGWCDEEMYAIFCYDVYVRYALGYRQMNIRLSELFLPSWDDWHYLKSVLVSTNPFRFEVQK